MSSDLTRPIIGIEYRTAQEVFDIMCARLRVSASPSIGRVGVKALEWHGPDYEDEYWAASIAEKYVIRPPTGNGRWLSVVGGYFPTVEAAQAAAEAHNQSRILSTLVYHEEPAGDTQEAGWLSQFTVNNCNHAALDSAVGVLRTGLASGSYQQALWLAIVDYVERAAPAALVSPPDNGGWMPIETAPKDGTWIIVRTGQIQDGRWAPFSDRCFVVRHLGTTERLGIDIGWGHCSPAWSAWLTHWQPLPSPPALQSHNEGSDGK